MDRIRRQNIGFNPVYWLQSDDFAAGHLKYMPEMDNNFVSMRLGPQV